jgi:flavin reductase (DIM6/NTAB) family NADH-FMN oxidoreductase RutF
LKKRLLGPCVTFFPQPATLIATRDNDGKVNLMMASWVGIVSKTPPTIAVSLHHNRKTLANILDTGVFSVNTVTSQIAAAADACGLVSGKRADKRLLTGLKIVPGVLEGTPLVAASTLNVECRYQRLVELGDYRLVMGEIAEIHACDRAFDDQGQGNVQVFDPLVYLGGLREYWSLGEKQGDAYRAGLAFLDQEEA